jgi:replicative DNA helicase
MTAAPAAKIELSEVDVELTLLGSLFINDGAFEQFAPLIKPEWFGDRLAQYLYAECMKIIEAGNRISPPAIMAVLPVDLGGISRGEFYSRACAAGLSVTMIGSLVATLKDRWARRSLVAMGQAAIEQAKQFEADPYQVASVCLADLDTLMEVQSSKSGVSLNRSMQDLFEDIASPDALQGATTGLRVLDSKLNGYRRGQLYVIAGRPGMGKSAFMCSSLRQTALSGTGVAVFSLEMTRQEISARMISDQCDWTGAPKFGDIVKGNVGEHGDRMAQAYDELRGAPMHIDDSARLTFAEIAAKSRRLKSEMAAHGVTLGVVCIDHMGLVTPSDRYAGNKVMEAGEVSGRARALAKELDCCVILLCQLSREVEKREDKRPVMSDLRWSGEIEQDAHVIGFLYREEYYLNLNPDADQEALRDARWKMDFLIRKNRNGETADCRLWCSIAHSSIRDNQ